MSAPITHALRCTALMLALLLTAACQQKQGKTASIRSAYYWSTTFDNDTALQQLVKEQHISRIYLRFFDVVVQPDKQVMPNATVRFATPVPEGTDIVPTVFIVNDCFYHDTGDLDQKILGRVTQMCETHDIAGVHEIQIDCDWTARTRKAYFDFLGRLASAAAKRGIDISATIRLHQLADKAPPVKRGVLMMYNTGDVRDLSHNPILEEEAVKPYLRHIAGYSLPLATAYPIFEWQLLVHGNTFVSIQYGDDEYAMLPGDTIIGREASPETVVSVRDAVTRLRPDANAEVIIFDISKKNIQRFNTLHYEKIFHP